MYGFDDLKKVIKSSNSKVECPVRDCTHYVPRMTKRGPNLQKNIKYLKNYLCSKHGIYISPTTFKYIDESENILWKDYEDKTLLDNIRAVKRECRFEHDRSEDAVSWNVFRFLEKNDLLTPVFTSLLDISCCEIIYWSYSQCERGGWSKLDEARSQFSERRHGGSEPDIIILGGNSLIFIEAKFGSGNSSSPRRNLPIGYIDGGKKWYEQVFNCSGHENICEQIAIKEGKYELFRLWLIGTWLANQYGLHFRLVNLVLDRKEKNVSNTFGRYLKQDQNRKFVRLSWEEIYSSIKDSQACGKAKNIMSKYFENKTLGYSSSGKLQKAFY